jgi:hypothetical protein
VTGARSPAGDRAGHPAEGVRDMLDAEEVYHLLLARAQDIGMVSDYADEKLAEAAEAIARDSGGE